MNNCILDKNITKLLVKVTHQTEIPYLETKQKQEKLLWMN